MKASKIRKAANGQTCIRCGAPSDTVCARHYNGVRQHQYGKGRGIKCHDLASAELCSQCDALFSEGSREAFESALDRDEDFLHWCMMTNIRRFNEGVLKA